MNYPICDKVFVITKTHFTGADQYTSVFSVYTNKEQALSVAKSLEVGDLSSCYNVCEHNLIGY